MMIIAQIKQFISIPFRRFLDGTRLFYRNHGLMVSAAVSFYLLMAALPFLVMSIGFLGKILGNITLVQLEVLTFLKQFFPKYSRVWMAPLESLIFSPISFNWINFIILLLGMLGFSTSLFHGVHILVGEKFHGFRRMTLKSLGILLLLLLSLGLLIALTPAGLFLSKYLDPEFWQNIRNLTNSDPFSFWQPLKIIYAIFSVLYFGCILRYLFSHRITWKDAFWGSFAFTLLFYLGKFIFWLYIFYWRQRLKQSYGDLYSLIVALLWLYYLIGSFFYSACVACSENFKKE